ncbi:hypothetical protein [Streptomyces sp. NPDC057910]|uniref:hypothetical protein n=1 Tax=Streptomyces sp. NPDC057910 TaxID=3346278 RepID=UPI0036ED334D
MVSSLDGELVLGWLLDAFAASVPAGEEKVVEEFGRDCFERPAEPVGGGGDLAGNAEADELDGDGEGDPVGVDSGLLSALVLERAQRVVDGQERVDLLPGSTVAG